MTHIGPGRSTRPLLLAACLAGCDGATSPDSIPAVPTSGGVSIRGKPLEQGTIQLVPKEGRPASGQVKAGRFVVTTYVPYDGAIPGRHQVAITSMKTRPAGPGAGAKAEAVQEIDPKYALPDQSGIVVDIPPEGRSDILIDLP